MKIEIKTNKDKDFYQLIGSYLANRKVEKEIGYKIYDDDNKNWIFAIEDNILLGFCYYQKTSENIYHIGSCYIIDEFRYKGIFNNLLEEAIKNIKGTIRIRTKSKVMEGILLKNKFKKEAKIGTFIEFEKEV